MKTLYIVIILVVIAAVAAASYLLAVPYAVAQACAASGGTVTTSLCCLSSGNFPNSCLIGSCGCSLENSHQVTVCDCGEGKCWDGTTCVQA